MDMKHDLLKWGENVNYRCLLTKDPAKLDASTDKVKRNYHFPAPGRNCCNAGKHLEVSCSSNQKPGSDKCFEL